MSYLHHILFDPLSAAEQFKASLYLTPVVIVLALAIFAVQKFREYRDDD
jgi:hypothetical protein